MISILEKLARAYKLLKVTSSALGSLTDLQQIRNLGNYLTEHDAVSSGLARASSLDIGCGTQPKNPFQAQQLFGLDIRENPQKNIKFADLTIDSIPFPDESFDYITAHDFIEHVPRVIYMPTRRFPFVELMNEVWRALRPGGIFLSVTPIYPYSPSFRDPTHVNIISHETFPMYFCGKSRLAAMYGFRGSFTILKQGVRPPHLVSLLRKCVHPNAEVTDATPSEK